MSGTRAWHLVSRPTGFPDMSNFELKEVDLPPLEEGGVRVENKWLSVDPYMRGRMNDVKSYVPPFEVGAPLQGGAVGKVVESRSPHLQVGDTVFHMLGWREQAVAPAAQFNKVPAMGLPDEQWLGNMGLTGATASSRQPPICSTMSPGAKPESRLSTISPTAPPSIGASSAKGGT